MKKLLLGTSALIGATAIVASASAAPELSISGNLDFRLVGGEEAVNNAETLAGAGRANASMTGFTANDVGASENGYDFTRANSRSEIRFHAEGESDGGLTYGARIDYRYNNNNNDEAYIFISGDWGTFHLGDDDGVIDARVPNAGHIAPGAYLIDDTTTYLNPETNSDIDGTKVSYFSSNLNGFQFGISAYEQVSARSAGYTVDIAESYSGNFEDIYEIAVSYDFEFLGNNHTVGLGYQVGDANTDPGQTTPAGVEDLAEYTFGFILNYGDFSLAGSYNDAGDSGIVTGDTRQEARTYYSIGVAYNLGGGMAVGLSHAEAETTAANVANGGLGADGDLTRTLTTVDFGFPILPGMAGYAGVAMSELEVGTGNNNSIDATTYLVGTTVSF